MLQLFDKIASQAEDLTGPEEHIVQEEDFERPVELDAEQVAEISKDLIEEDEENPDVEEDANARRK